ncbi:nitric oxide reductase transcriptional regulator NorR [Pseudoalteromonas tunicata]|uniref:nitric oxide reductase transcriptional regulator NorR n=1 Tax=Pseudoalteromonas tunicata TaxID=314281 RepID=UPI00273E4C3B|nr:nitric oxide reductase transcriptional regulator NorR [Pseudoalteromonas tunicata]MDP4984496.1 nitric oxide reductase transcriptional regulator NorR [Pseudoalteromonas tunicata]
MTISNSALVELALDLTKSLNNQDRFERLLDTIRKTILCDAIALLILQGNHLKPVAMQGLSRDTLGRRFVINEHPRFAIITQAERIVRFEHDSPLPDPYDGLLLDRDDDLPMHSCMGFPLIAQNKLIGVLTLDSLAPHVFSNINERTLDIIAAMAAATLNTAMNLEQLELLAKHNQEVVAELTQEAWQKDGGEIIGQSPAVQNLKNNIQIAAGSDLTILVYGETGVGKELVARTLHQSSLRNHQPLVYVNCAALPETLIESELFGHVKGAFTGALNNRAGKFALAHGGTIFLDEIGELPLIAQSKLLRVLQNNEIQPVGQDQVQLIDVRVVAATNRDLKTEVAEGRFRADLFHRLSAYPIEVPALRNREGDVHLLIGFFLEQARRKFGLTQLKMSAGLQLQLTHYNWPGNVRELEHLINRATLRAKARNQSNYLVTLEQQDCLDTLLQDTKAVLLQKQPADLLNIEGTPNCSLKDATLTFQRKMIITALHKHQGKMSAAALELQLDRANLARLCKRLSIVITKNISG